MLYLSASSIRDYWECPARFNYRREQPESAELNDDVVFGTIIHETIEKYDNADDAIAAAMVKWDEYCMQGSFAAIPRTPPKSIDRILSNYYGIIVPQLKLTSASLVEYKFKVKWTEDISIVGKMDLISGNSIYDWKTGAREPTEYSLQDIQFYIYYIMYPKIFGNTPDAVLYGHLYSGSLLPIDIKPALVYNTSTVIDRVANDVLQGKFEHRTGYQCNKCFYRKVCFDELNR
jgi:CRISPR/Cas system-associated exonuclease Cas4 (RecB family)